MNTLRKTIFALILFSVSTGIFALNQIIPDTLKPGQTAHVPVFRVDGKDVHTGYVAVLLTLKYGNPLVRHKVHYTTSNITPSVDLNDTVARYAYTYFVLGTGRQILNGNEGYINVTNLSSQETDEIVVERSV